MVDPSPEPVRSEGPAEDFPRAFGAYTLLAELGRGAMGIVYEAVHRDLGRRAAVKVLKTGFDADPETRERFRREARACAQVRHDHIVQIYEAGEAEGRPFYAMDLLAGETLAAKIAARAVPPPPDLLRGLAGVADALQALHEAGVVHRDVKPSNIMVRPDGRMVLADFGLARTATSTTLTSTGDILGTPLYMSPEQVRGEKGGIDARTDVYGLGATLYESLTGRPVFATENVLALTEMVLTRRPDPPRRVAPEVPADCERIALKALEKRKEDRYQTAAAMRDDLLAFPAGQSVQGRPVSRPVRALRAARRHPVVVAATGLAAAAALWYALRPAQVAIASFPAGAEILVDGGREGSTPTSLSLSPGAHDLMLRREHFVDLVRRDRFDAGPNRIDLPLIPSDADGFRLLMDSMGVPAARFARPEGARAAPDGAPVELWVPRGHVRLDDLTTFVMDIDADRVLPGGTIEFRDGAQSLWKTPFDAKVTPFERSIPASVREAVHVGESVEWGWWPEDGKPITASFTVVEGGPLPAFQAAERRLVGLPGHLAQHAMASILLDRHLLTAAFLQARAVALSDEADVRAMAEMSSALEGLGLGDSRKAAELRAQIRNAPPSELLKVFGE